MKLHFVDATQTGKGRNEGIFKAKLVLNAKGCTNVTANVQLYTSSYSAIKDVRYAHNS